MPSRASFRDFRPMPLFFFAVHDRILVTKTKTAPPAMLAELRPITVVR
jgi:hypothetical protein